MGGFVLIHAVVGRGSSVAQTAALGIFARMGFSPPRLIQGENYILGIFPKRQSTELALQEFPNGDFVFACGTLIYDNMFGKSAAAAFYRDYSAASDPRNKAMGHYAVILRKGGVTEILLDGLGGFHVFYDKAKGIASSSFLLVASALARVTLARMEAYEYVFNGFVSGNTTVFDEIALAPAKAVIGVRRQGLNIRQLPPSFPQTISTETCEATVKQSMELLDCYFSAVVSSFGGRVTCALSGGYDSRLMLALLRRHGVQPRVYVYGQPADKDVEIARAIAKGESFALEIVDKAKQIAIDPSEFGATAYENFLASDGYTWDGIFHNGAERVQRVSRLSGDSILLNGGGGEIWRNAFYLPDRSYTPRELIWSRWSPFDPKVCGSVFRGEDYFRCLEDKLAVIIGERRASLSRTLVEWLYHTFRCRSWDGRMNSIKNGYGYAALPFVELMLTEHASTLPIRWKNHGAYEAELIRRADPRLASYPSRYGHDFSGPPSFTHRLADYGTLLRPPQLRRLTYRVKHRARRAGVWPNYLRKEYRDAALPGGIRLMTKLFNLERVTDPDQLARILSLEYLVRYFDNKMRLDFQHFPPDYKKCAA